MPADSKPAAILNALATDWTALSLEEKVQYKNMVCEDQVRYDREMNELATTGCFMRENGVRSRNHNEEEYARKHSDFDVKTILIPVKPKRSIKPFE